VPTQQYIIIIIINPNNMSNLSFEAFGITLEDVLFGVRQAPLDRDGLRNYLVKEQAEENLDFWLTAESFKEQTTGEKYVIKGKPYSVPVPADAIVEDPTKWSQKIVQDFVGDHATKAQINISGAMAKSLIDDAQHGKIPNFAPPQKETVNMMTVPFQRFVVRVFEQNIDDDEIDVRRKNGIISLLFCLLLGLLLQYLTVQQSLLPRYGLFIVLVPVSGLYSYLLWSSYWKL
jgi:hypothetical protein